MTISSVSSGFTASAPRTSSAGLDAKISQLTKQVADVQKKLLAENNSTTDDAKTKQELVAAYQAELAALQAELQQLQQQKTQAAQSSSSTSTVASRRSSSASSSASDTDDASGPKTTGVNLDAEA